MTSKTEMSPEMKAHLKRNLIATFNISSLNVPSNSQRKKPWENQTQEFIADNFGFKVREIGNDKNQEPFMLLAGGPGLPHSSDYKSILAPKNSKRAIMFEPRCVADNQHITVNHADNDEARHQAFIKSLEFNTLQNQIEDIEKARLLIAPDKKICIRGDSWGSTLALAYAQKYPKNVSALILNLPFLASKDDFEMRRGKNGEHAKKYAKEYKEYLKTIDETPETISADPKEVAHKFLDKFTSANLSVRDNAFKAWMQWESLCDGREFSSHNMHDEGKRRTAMIVAHYHAHGAFLPDCGVLTNPQALKEIPIFAIGNSCDPLVAPDTLVKLVEAAPHARIVDIPRKTHSKAGEDEGNKINLEEMGAVNQVFTLRGMTPKFS